MPKEKTLLVNGDKIADRFTVVEFIGAGGVGEVYKVEDRQGAYLCCKVLKPKAVPSYIKMEKLETLLFENVPALPGVLRPLTLFEFDGKRFILSDYFEGVNFRTMINNAGPDQGVDMMTACQVVDHLLVILSAFPPLSVHGMLKPSNVHISNLENGMLTENSDVVITGFGAGKIVSFSKFASIQLSRGRDYYYLAPEFISQGGNVKRAADIYALGMMLFEAISGKIPKKNEISIAKIIDHINPELSDVIEKALNPQPDKRYQEFGVMRQALKDALPDLPEYIQESKRKKTDSIETEDIFSITEDDVDLADKVEELDVFEGVKAGDLDQAVEILKSHEESPSGDDQKKIETLKDQWPEEGRDPGVKSGNESEKGSSDKGDLSKSNGSPPRAKSKGDAWQWIFGAIIVLAIVAAIIIKLYLMDTGKKPVPPAPTPVKSETPLPEEPSPDTGAVDKVIEKDVSAKLEKVKGEAGGMPSADEKKITLLVEKGEVLKKSEKLIAPAENCLFGVIGEIEKIDPENRYAKGARKYIVKVFIEKANALLEINNWEKATVAVNAGLKVDKESDRLHSLLDKIQSEQRGVITGQCPDGMAFVQGGTLRMGSNSNDKNKSPGEFNYESIFVAAFCVDKHEFPNIPGRTPEKSINWKEAEALCEKAGKRLCLEKEWERACKGSNNFRYPYGDAFNPSICNTADEKGLGRKIAVAGKMKSCKSGFGVYDLSGNVKEWTASKIAAGTNAYVVKGGSWALAEKGTRCAMREFALPDETSSFLGLRCCRDV